jgi:hypothetical protein
MSNDEIHPLDQEDELEEQLEKSNPMPRDSQRKNTLKWLAISIGTCLALAFLGAGVMNSNASGTLEGIGFFINRIAMAGMLISCIAALITLRAKQLQNAFQFFANSRTKPGTSLMSRFFSTLFAWVAICLLILGVTIISPSAALITPTLLAPVLLSVSLCMAMQTTHVARAYWIGFFVALLCYAIPTVPVCFYLWSTMSWPSVYMNWQNRELYRTSWIVNNLSILAVTWSFLVAWVSALSVKLMTRSNSPSDQSTTALKIEPTTP